MNAQKTIEMDLKDGRLLTLEVSDALLTKVKDAFMLPSVSDVSDAHVKHFIVSSMKNALEAS